MAIQNVIGDSFRGATGVLSTMAADGGEVINGGFGMVLTDRKKHQNESNPCFSGMSTTEFQELGP
jgi:hypothetical protein